MTDKWEQGGFEALEFSFSSVFYIEAVDATVTSGRVMRAFEGLVAEGKVLSTHDPCNKTTCSRISQVCRVPCP
ncbi:hypothetical protein HGM15179_009724, partial [Zosterops borbonicus]